VNAFRQKYQLPFPYIIHTGRFDPRKNIVGLLKAFKQFKAESKNDLKLVLPGDFQNLRNFKFFYNPEKIVADLDLTADVIFPGYIHEDDFPLLYNEAVFSIYPSLYEGFGLPIVESMACGTPVITSNCSSMPEVAGEAGILVDPKSIGHMAAAMTELYENSQLREDLSKKGLVQCQKFSWEKAAKDILSVYKEIV
jgi:glycosyltransferase involved in cell wall biosynthesis